ncbi:hypothetical protein Bca4012_026662 [Brassica carinata]
MNPLCFARSLVAAASSFQPERSLFVNHWDQSRAPIAASQASSLPDLTSVNAQILRESVQVASSRCALSFLVPPWSSARSLTSALSPQVDKSPPQFLTLRHCSKSELYRRRSKPRRRDSDTAKRSS